DIALAEWPPVEDAAAPEDEDSREGDRALAAALESAAAVWSASPPPDAPPSPGRLAILRRRYHELGASNPFAVTEYAEVRERLPAREDQGGEPRAAPLR